MNKIIAKVLAFLLLFNVMPFSNIDAFANSKQMKVLKKKNVNQNVKNDNKVNFEWVKRRNLHDTFKIEDGSPTIASDKGVLLKFDFSEIGGGNVVNTNTTLKYNIADNKKIKMTITKEGEKATFKYEVNNTDKDDDNDKNNKEDEDYGNKVDKKDKIFEIFKEEKNEYITANTTNFPENGDIELTSLYGNDKDVREVEFRIKEGTGINFKYQGNIVKIYWDKKGKMFFAADDAINGNIYDFNIEVKSGSDTYNDSKKIFKGIDTKAKFSAKPYANAKNGSSGKETIEQITRPITETPGDKKRGVEIKFEAPKVWNELTDKFEREKGRGPSSGKVIKSIFNLVDNDTTLQITINNIYMDKEAIITSNTSGANDIKAKSEYNIDTNMVTLTIEGLNSGVIYKDATITTEKVRPINEKFDYTDSNVGFGKIYTYPEFRIESVGDDEFYLNITPFKGYNGTYRIYEGTGEQNIKKWIDYEEKNKGAENIQVPVVLSALNPMKKYFQIGFSRVKVDPSSEPTIKSQKLHYMPFLDDVILATPRNFKIKDKYIVRSDDKKETLYLDLSWDIGYLETIKKIIEQNKASNNLKIEYKFNKGETPTKVNDDLTGVDITFKNAPDDNNLDKVDIKLKKGTNNIELDESKSKIKSTERIINGKPKKVATANIRLKIPVSSVDSNEKKVLEYPKVYFLTLKGEYNTSTANKSISRTSPISLTLDGVSDIAVPTPQNMEVEKLDKKEFTINFDTLKYDGENDLLYKYNEIMLNTINKTLTKDSVRYDFYISKDRKILEKMIDTIKNKDEKNLTDKFSEEILNKIKTYDFKNKKIEQSGADINMKTIKIEDKLLIDYIRDEEVVKIKNIKQNFDSGDTQKINFKQLDENETYYVIGMTKLVPYKDDNSNAELEKDMDTSKLSKIITVTTTTGENTPQDSEKIPTATDSFIAKDITMTSVNLLWDRVSEVQDNKDKSNLEYQFIQTKGKPMSEAMLKSRNSFEKTIKDLSNIKNKNGMRTIADKVYEYDKVKNKFSDTESKNHEYKKNLNGQGIIIDRTLSANQVYFYYIRTVRMLDGKDEAYSVWTPLTFTTPNVLSPTNLRVEQSATYDKKSEVVISFDIPNVGINLVGTDYGLQYSVKEDTKPWEKDINMAKSDLTLVESVDKKTIKVTYKIKGLKSGSLYTIRVRMKDKKLDALSAYSNEVTHKTDSDNADNDFDQDIQDSENSFKKAIDKLKKDSYWFLENTNNTTKVYYRPQYFDGILLNSKTGNIELVPSLGAYKEYYIPASAIDKAFSQNKGFSISYKDANVIFSAKSIDPNTNISIKNIINNIKAKNDNLDDYFIKITTDFRDIEYSINGEISISPYVNISASADGTNKAIIDFDTSMISYIEKLLKTEDFSTKFKEEVSKLIKEKAENTSIVKFINATVSRFTDIFGDKLQEEIKNMTEQSVRLSTLNKFIIYTYPNKNNIKINGYRIENGRWNLVPTSMYQGKNAIHTKNLSELIFTGKKLIINGIGNMQNADKITNIINKYSLDDYLATNGAINIKSNMSRNMLIGSLARIAGANKTKDPIMFFKSKNVIIPNRNVMANISSEEAVYLMMKTYEIRTNSKIDNVKIRNYNLTSGIKNINRKYKKSIQVAFNLGIYNNPNMNAKGAISVEEFLKSIANMSNIISI